MEFEGLRLADGTTLTNLTAETGNTAARPASPIGGQLYFNTQTVDLEVYDGTSAWLATVGGGTMNDLIDDTTPTLGGALDAGTFNITNTGLIVVGAKAAEAWHTSREVIQIGNSSSISSANTNASVEIGNNLYYTTANALQRIEIGYTSSIEFELNGVVNFNVATTDAADSVITWTTTVLTNAGTWEYGGDIDIKDNIIKTTTTDGNINISPSGTGNVILGTMTLDSDQVIGAGQDNFVLTYDNATGLVSLVEAAVGTLKTKVIDIGDWDMSTATGAAQASVTHGLTATSIRTVSVLIRDDAGTTMTDLSFIGSGGGLGGGAYVHPAGLVISLERATSGYFDTVNYDATTFNRGWITIQYV